MNLLQLIVILVVIGIVMYLINSYIPMAEGIRRLLNIAVIIFLIIWLLEAFGLLGPLSNVRIGR